MHQNKALCSVIVIEKYDFDAIILIYIQYFVDQNI